MWLGDSVIVNALELEIPRTIRGNPLFATDLALSLGLLA